MDETTGRDGVRNVRAAVRRKGRAADVRPHSYGTVTVIWTKDMDERLCELVAEDCYSFSAIARMMGLASRDMVTSRWRRLVAQLGYQAQWPTPYGPGKHALSGEQKTRSAD